MTGSLRDRLKYALERIASLKQRFQRTPQMEQRTMQAFFAYDPPSYAGRVLLLETELSPARCTLASTWKGLLTGPVESRKVAGNHVSVLVEPNISKLAATISRCTGQTATLSHRR